MSDLPGMRIGLGFDVHAFGGSGPLVLGGVTIPDAPGLAGHSDADVVAHAVADALLGALGLDDLGTRFPADDERYRDAASIEFLKDIADDIAPTGYRIANIDVVIAAEAPPLAAHMAAMRVSVGDALVALAQAPGSRPPVNVKPKRAEGVGAVGRGEGIAAWAAALLVRETPPGAQRS
jgi:2-C-methyl-D-erythritol 2,4-cyclodiphosphate synthase